MIGESGTTAYGHDGKTACWCRPPAPSTKPPKMLMHIAAYQDPPRCVDQGHPRQHRRQGTAWLEQAIEKPKEIAENGRGADAEVL